MIRMIDEIVVPLYSSQNMHMKWPMSMQEPIHLGSRLCEIQWYADTHSIMLALQRMQKLYI